MSGLEPPTGTKDPFYSGWSHQPGQKGVLLSRLVLPPGTKCPEPLVPVGPTNRDKRGSFCPSWCLQPGPKAPIPLPARLAVGPGTKATFGPGSKDNRDKWLGSKACSVVVNQSKIRCISLTLHATHCFPLGIPHLVATIQNVRCDISYLSQPTKF